MSLVRAAALLGVALLAQTGAANAHPVATLIGTVQKNGEINHKLVSNCKNAQRTVYLQGSKLELDRLVGKTAQVTGDVLMPRDPLNGNKMYVLLVAAIDLKGKTIETLRGKVDRRLVDGKATWVFDEEKGEHLTLLATAGGVGDFSWWIDDGWTVRATGYRTDKGFVVLEAMPLQLFGGKDPTGPIAQRADPEAKACHVGAVQALEGAPQTD